MTNNNTPVELTDKLRNKAGDSERTIQEKFNKLYDWMIEMGNEPRRHNGMAESTSQNYISRLDQLYRMAIEYTNSTDYTHIQDDQADEMLLLIDRAEITTRTGEEYSETAKRKFADCLQKYFEWQYYEGPMEYEWEPKINFSDGKSESAYRFTYSELGQLFEAAQSHGSLPSYYDTPTKKRTKINSLVAQRLGIPQDEVTQEDWTHADWSRKVCAMVMVGHDAGLTPVEIANAELQWYESKTNILKIPTEYSCKERKKQKVALSDKASEALGEWLQERRHISKYDGSSKIWLNREANPYQSGSLCKLLRKLCDEAGIKTEDRRIVWYSLRTTMGTNLTDQGELAESNDQLRHERLSTTQENYNHTPVEKLQSRLNDIYKRAEKAVGDPDYNPYDKDQQTSDTQSTGASSQQNHNGSNELIKSTKGGNIHLDVVIPDTTEDRVDIAHHILPTDD